MSEAGERTVYAVNRRRLALMAGLALLFVVVGLWIIFDAKQEPGVILIGATVAVFFGFSAGVILLRAFSNKPGLALSPAGFEAPLTFEGTVPWARVTNLTRSQVSRSDFLKIALDPAFSQSMVWHGFMARMNRYPKSLSVSLSQLDRPADEIAQRAALLWQEHRGAAGMPMAERSASSAATLASTKTPYVTYLMLLLFAAIYVCELVFGVDDGGTFQPSVKTLAYLGGDVGVLIKSDGEYWRMFTAPLLHANPTHLLLNGVVFWIAGTLLERILGWKWLLGIFCLSALGGEVATLIFLDPKVVAVGASGGLMGMLAALLLAAGRLPQEMATRWRLRAMQLLIPSLLPLLSARGNGVNYYAHAGGAVIGALLGLLLWKCWKRDQPRPPLENLALLAAIGFFAVSLYAIIPIAHWLTSR